MPLPPSFERYKQARAVLTIAAGDTQLQLVLDAIAASLLPSIEVAPEPDDAYPELTQAFAKILESNRKSLAEDQIGLSFVACQGAIRRTYAQMKAFDEAYGGTKQPMQTLPFLLENEVEGWPTAQAAIWHAGNYFKHRDDWPADRTKLTKREKPTWEAVKKLGVGSGSKTPMLECLIAVCGAGELHDLVPMLGAHIGAWRHLCANVCRSNLGLPL